MVSSPSLCGLCLGERKRQLPSLLPVPVPVQGETEILVLAFRTCSVGLEELSQEKLRLVDRTLKKDVKQASFRSFARGGQRKDQTGRLAAPQCGESGLSGWGPASCGTPDRYIIRDLKTVLQNEH